MAATVINGNKLSVSHMEIDVLDLFLLKDFVLVEELCGLDGTSQQDSEMDYESLAFLPCPSLPPPKAKQMMNIPTDSPTNFPTSLKNIKTGDCIIDASTLSTVFDEEAVANDPYGDESLRSVSTERAQYSSDSLEFSSKESSLSTVDGSSTTFLNSNKDWLNHSNQFDFYGKTTSVSRVKCSKKKLPGMREKKKRYDFEGRKEILAQLLKFHQIILKEKKGRNLDGSRFRKLSLLLNLFINKDTSHLTSVIGIDSCITIIVPNGVRESVEGPKAFNYIKKAFHMANKSLRECEWVINVGEANKEDEQLCASFDCCAVNSTFSVIRGSARCCFKDDFIVEATIQFDELN